MLTFLLRSFFGQYFSGWMPTIFGGPVENHKDKQPNISRCEAMQPLQGKILSHNISKSVLGCLDFQVGNTSVFYNCFQYL